MQQWTEHIASLFFEPLNDLYSVFYDYRKRRVKPQLTYC